MNYKIIFFSFYILLNSNLYAQSCVDTDGDGWGWDGVQSCRVESTSKTCVDSDGDGWGWDGEASCVVESNENDTSENSADCVDEDGDGWGWDGVKSCKTSNTQSSDCIDSDGDGWGWDGQNSCKVENQDQSQAVVDSSSKIQGLQFNFPGADYLNSGAFIYKGDLLFFISVGKIFEPTLPSYITSNHNLFQFKHIFMNTKGDVVNLPTPETLELERYVIGSVIYKVGTQITSGDQFGNLQLAERVYFPQKGGTPNNPLNLLSNYEYKTFIGESSELEISESKCQGLGSIYGCIVSGATKSNDIVKRGNYKRSEDELDRVLSLGKSFPANEIPLDSTLFKDPKAKFSMMQAKCVGKNKIFSLIKNWDANDFKFNQLGEKTAYAFHNKDLSGDLDVVYEISSLRGEKVTCNHGANGELLVHISSTLYDSPSKNHILFEKQNEQGKRIIETPEISNINFAGSNTTSYIAGAGNSSNNFNLQKVFLWDTGEIVPIPQKFNDGILKVNFSPKTGEICYSSVEVDIFGTLNGGVLPPNFFFACENINNFKRRAGKVFSAPDLEIRKKPEIVLNFKEPIYYLPR